MTSAHIHRFATTVTVWRIIASAPLLMLVLVATSDAAGLADRVPQNASLLVSSSHVDQTCKRFEKTLLGNTLCGSEFTPLVKELDKRHWSSPMYLRPAFGFDWSELSELSDPGGFTAFTADDGSSGLAWMFLPQESIAKLPPLLIKGASHFKERGYTRKIEYRDNFLLAIFQPRNRSQRSRVYFASSRFYGAANTLAAAETILKVKAGSSLSTNVAFKKTQLAAAETKTLSSAIDADFFIRPMSLWELLEKDREQQDSAASNALAKARRQGMDDIQAMAGVAHFDTAAPCGVEFRAKMLAPRPYHYAMRLMALKPGPVPPPADWLSADFTNVFFWQWDFPMAMKGFGSVFDESNWPGPDGEGLFEETLDGLRDDPEMRLDMRCELFAQLGPRMLRFSDEGDRKTGSAQSEANGRWLYVAAIRDRKRVLAAFQRFYKGDKDVSHERLGSHEVWTVAEGRSLFIEGESDSVVMIRALAVGGNELFFSTDADLLKAAIQGGDARPRLSKDVGSQRMLGWLKQTEISQTSLRGLSRLDRSLEESYQSATTAKPKEDDGMMTQVWMYLLYGTTDRSLKLPYSAAPDYDLLRSGLPLSGLVLSQTADGWTLRLGMSDTATAAGAGGIKVSAARPRAATALPSPN